MKTIDQYTIQDYFDEAPKKIQDVIVNNTVRNTTIQIAKAHKLTEDQTSKLENEIVFILFAIEPMKDFLQNIITHLNIDSNLAKSINYNVNDQLFKPVEDDIEMMRFIFNTYEQQLNKSELKPKIQEGSTPIVQPIRTMKTDMDKVHGYGAYRKMYPGQTSATNNPAEQQSTTESAPTLTETNNDDVVQATSQDDVLDKKPLTKTPTYAEEKKGYGE